MADVVFSEITHIITQAMDPNPTRSEITHVITQAMDPNPTRGLDMGVLTCLRWGSRKEIWIIRRRRKFRRCLPAGSTFQNPFQDYVLCDRRLEGKKMERRRVKVT
jgi:hypothetical protein